MKDSSNDKLGEVFRTGGTELGVERGLVKRKDKRWDVGRGWDVQDYQNLEELWLTEGKTR
jgi:hypothetical protein